MADQLISDILPAETDGMSACRIHASFLSYMILDTSARETVLEFLHPCFVISAVPKYGNARIVVLHFCALYNILCIHMAHICASVRKIDLYSGESQKMSAEGVRLWERPISQAKGQSVSHCSTLWRADGDQLYFYFTGSSVGLFRGMQFNEERGG